MVSSSSGDEESVTRARVSGRTDGDPDTAEVTCPVVSRDVRLMIFNGTRREGPGGGVADDLERRGFVIEEVGNNPQRNDR